MSERLGLPSASSLERIALCPGSHYAEMGRPEETSDIQSEGTLVHQILSGEKQVEELDESLHWIIETIASEELRITAQIFGQTVPHPIMERRMWYEEAGLKIFSGQPDRIYISKDYTLLIDYKAGFKAVEDIAKNYQLMAYVVLTAREFGAKEVFAAVIQPRTGRTTEIARYDEQAIGRAEEKIKQLLSGATIEAPRNPSLKACEYCKAKGICREAITMATSIVPVNVNPAEVYQTLKPEEKADVLSKISFAEKIFKAVKDEAKKELEQNPDAIPGFYLKPGNNVRNISDNEEAMRVLRGEGISPEEILHSLKLPVGSIEDLLKAKKGISKNEAKELVNQILPLDTKPNAPSLAYQG